jgi:sarcosine oxidase subunit gamma
MSSARASPLFDRLRGAPATWCELNGMVTPAHIGLPASDRDPTLTDVSALWRCGLKGPNAAAWLAVQGIAVPEQPNRWLPLDGGGLVARLGRSEYLVESALAGMRALELWQALRQPAAGVYPVLRQDCALVLRGRRSRDLLLQTCSVNLCDIPADNREVTLTSMAGVGVTVLNQFVDDPPCHRIWCDGTFGLYLWDTLLEIAMELGGGALGLADLYPQAEGLTPAAV